MGLWIIHCECCGASLSQFRKSGKGEISWNTRPIEDALNARIAELELRLDVYNGNMYDVVVDELDKANARIAELEAENERLSQLLHECKALEAENAELRDVIGDYRSDASRVLDEKCPSDERHCGCVPILRDQLNKYQKALILITTMPELSQATTIAREALQERGKFIWTEQSVGEYWVTKLDILQDQYDTLEKDYADVCQKRLEAADVFSRQIIELESENAELEAERRWIPVSERLPEDGDFVLGWGTDEIIEVLEFCTEYGDNCFYNIAGDTISITHWMPLPEPPEVEK